MNQNTVKPCQIVPATLQDIGAIAELARLIWLRHYPGIITLAQISYMLDQRYSEAVLHDQICGEGRWLDKLVCDGQILGFSNYYREAEAGVMKLDRLYLHPDHHGQGWGAALIRHCEDMSRREGCQRLILAVNKQNKGSIGFYQRQGFAVEDAITVDIGSGFVMDDYIMAKSLISCPSSVPA